MTPDQIEHLVKTVMEDSLGLSLEDDGEIIITSRKARDQDNQVVTANIINDKAEYYIRMSIDHTLRLVSINSYKLMDTQVLPLD